MRRTLSSILSVLLVGSFVFATTAPRLEAASSRKVAFETTMTADDLAEAYAVAAAGGEKVRILIMPGHEPTYGGAEFQGYYERELVVDIANRLQKELSADPNFEVLVARGNLGWNEDFERYFEGQERRIRRFVDEHKEAFQKLERRGRIDDAEEQAAHNAASEDAALRLYGINRWANDNGVDLVLHLHLNDELSHATNERGAHSGLAIYVPDEVYGNADVSRAVAQPIFDRLNAFTATSTFGLEQQGIVPDRELIAIGAYNTAETASLLIEYGYLYEPRLTGDGARDEVLADYAYATALGVKDFFGTPGRPRFSTKSLPYAFTSDALATTTASSTPEQARAIYALQASLKELGFYPGTEASLAECPVSGIANVCTAEAVKAFQASKGLEQTGGLGPRTRAALGSAFGLAAPIATPVPAPATPVPSDTVLAGETPDRCVAFAHELEPDSEDADTGGEVTRLQSILAQDTEVYPEGRVTGYFGPATLAAVKRFQEKLKIATKDDEAYGLVGPKTKQALVSACLAAS